VVPAQLFTPPPKIDSQVLMLTYRSEPLFPGIDVRQFFRIVKAGFAQRRKTLLNSIGAGLQLDRQQTGLVLAAADIDPSARAQNLTLDDWFRLYQAVQ
jgi:16S rRNA (adenine1518-N6/adenine1519-N6)-dimethyltransferase